MVKREAEKLTFHIDSELKRRFKKYCVERNISMRAVITAGIKIALTNKSGIEQLALKEMKKKE